MLSPTPMSYDFIRRCIASAPMGRLLGNRPLARDQREGMELAAAHAAIATWKPEGRHHPALRVVGGVDHEVGDVREAVGL